MSWYDAAGVDEVAPGTTRMVDIAGKRLAICNAKCDTDEGFYTIDNKCTHDGGPLNQGFLDGCQIECPRHGARFDVRTGKVLRLPAVRPVHSYATRVTGGRIEVEVGD
ncbi:non-heme iron oxygenase ferredoxin subunit [bacterium]|nr:non-heme iron oxygenase ferredoxin subunit [bacterium]